MPTGTVTYSAVLFDLDGTLCEQAQSPEAVYRGAFEAAGIEPFGEPDDLWAALGDSPPPDDEANYLAAGFTKVAAQHGRAPVDAVALGEGFLKVVDYARVTPSPGAETAVETARNHARVGVVTNGPESRQAQKLDALPFGDRFEAIVYAGDLPRRKPHRDPFDAALEALDVSASDALYVGDSLEYDVAGAQNAGLTSAWYSPTGADPEPYRPEHVLGSLSDLGGVVDP